MRKSYNRPRNPQDFELLCLKLLRAYWSCPELELYATSGQVQHGVDIVDLSGQEPLHAAQCKLHEEGKVTTRSEVENEIEKAKRFTPPLDRYVIVTTGKVGKEVHDLLIETNIKHRGEDLFVVEVFDWGRIEELLDEYTEIRDWYEVEPSAIAIGKLESKIDKIPGIIEQRLGPNRGDDNQDGFHAEIDEARDSLDQHNYQLAKLLLQRIKVRSWDKLNARHKFRLLTNLAVVESSADNHKQAAELCLEAKKHQPSDELALTNEAYGYLILEQRKLAFELASRLREEFPRSARALGAFIQSAPDSTALESLEESVPQDLFAKDEVAVALTHRALDSDELQKAEEFIRAATDAKSRASMPWLLLGQIILRSEISMSYQKHGAEAWVCDQDRLREAEDAFGQALLHAKKEQSTSVTLEALLSRSQTRFVLNKNVEASEDLKEALQVAPENPRVAETYGESLRLNGKADEAIEFMRRVPQEDLSDHGRLMLGMMLVERGDPGDYRSAEGLLSQVAKTEAKLPEDFREHAIDIGLQAFASQNRFDASHKLLEKIPEGTISDVGFKTLTARLHLLEGLQEKASQWADQALVITDEATTVFDIRRLARLLVALGRFNDALPLWQRISIPNVLSEDTKHLLECASRLNRHGIMLDTFRELREAGAIDRTLLDSELSLLELYDNDAAIKILELEISQQPDDKELKLRRSMLGLALDRADLVDQDLSSVPEADEVEPGTAVDAVRVLKTIGHEQYAVEYAYEVVRHNFLHPDAHRAFILALSPFGRESQLENPERIEAGTAVCYVEQGDSVPHWIIIENQPDPDSQFPERELPPDHEICKDMMGKKVGDSFSLAQGIQDRIGDIKQIQNKYVYRFQDCMGQWQVNFPELPYLQSVRIPQKTGDSGEPEPDISVILKFVDERHEHVSNVQGIYKENLLPIHMFGQQIGTTAFGALQHLAWSPDVSVKCCIGSAEEREHAAKAFRSCNTVVLDMSAISSLFLLDRIDILECRVVDFFVSQRTVAELLQMIVNESWFHSGKSGQMIKTETGFTLVEMTEEQKEAYFKKLRHLVKVLKTNCTIESGESLAAMEPEKRETLVKVFGQYGAEAISLSAVPGVALWTDDHAQAILAREEHGVSRVWTQFVIGACVELGAMDPEAFFDASAKLLGYGYYFTSENPQIIRQAGIIAEWRVDGWPLSQALSTFAEESIDLVQMLQLAAEFLGLLHQEPILPQTKVNITIQILENIAKRKGGLEGIQNLQKALPRLFGVNVIGLKDAVKTIKAWLKSTDALEI